jgi:hypothetical protein
MRKYQGIWERLKVQGHNGSVSISAADCFHKAIVKAVGKEKGKDIGYKISIEPKFAFLFHTRGKNMLTFHLHLQSRPDRRIVGFDPSNI